MITRNGIYQQIDLDFHRRSSGIKGASVSQSDVEVGTEMSQTTEYRGRSKHGYTDLGARTWGNDEAKHWDRKAPFFGSEPALKIPKCFLREAVNIWTKEHNDDYSIKEARQAFYRRVVKTAEKILVLSETQLRDYAGVILKQWNISYATTVRYWFGKNSGYSGLSKK